MLTKDAFYAKRKSLPIKSDDENLEAKREDICTEKRVACLQRERERTKMLHMKRAFTIGKSTQERSYILLLGLSQFTGSLKHSNLRELQQKETCYEKGDHNECAHRKSKRGNDAKPGRAIERRETRGGISRAQMPQLKSGSDFDSRANPNHTTINNRMES